MRTSPPSIRMPPSTGGRPGSPGGRSDRKHPMKLWISAAACLLLAAAVLAQDPPLTPRTLQEALAAKPSGADAEKLAERIRAYFGRENLARGPAAKIDELTVAWALESPEGPPPKVVSADGK